MDIRSLIPKDKAILYLALGETLVWAGLFYVFPALLLHWEDSFGWSRADITITVTIYGLISAMASPIGGRLIDSGHGPQMMAACSLIGGVCLALLSFVTMKWQFYAVWAVIGAVMGGCLYAPCFALVTRNRGEGAKRGIILITLAAGFAGTISFPSAHALTENYDWRVAVQVFALVIVFIATPLLWKGASAVEEAGQRQAEGKSEERRNSHDYLKLAPFWFLALSMACMGVIPGVTFQHLLPLIQDRGITPELAVVAASCIGPMQVTARLALMVFDRYTSNHVIAILCMLVMGISMLLLFGAGAFPILVVGFVILFGSANGTISVAKPLIVFDILGRQNFGAKSGTLAMFFLLGNAVAPYLGSLVWSVGGYDLVILGLAGFAILGLGFYLVSYTLSRRMLHKV